MTDISADSVSSGYGDTNTETQEYALRIGDKFAVIKPNPEETGKKFVTLFTKTGKKVIFKHTSVSRGTKIAAFFLEGNPPLIVKCEEIFDREPEGMTLLDLPALGSGSIRTWLGTK